MASGSGRRGISVRALSVCESGMSINGVLFPVQGNDMEAFDAREQGSWKCRTTRSRPYPGRDCRGKGRSGYMSPPSPARNLAWVYPCLRLDHVRT
jgi:hypothetical protein